MPPAANAAQPLALRVGVAEDEDLADQVVGHELERALAVALLPGLDHRVDLLAPAEPAEERRVDRHGRVGGEHPARRGSASSAGAGKQKKRQTSSLSGAPNASATWRVPLSGRKFVNAPSPSSPARPSIFPRSAATTIGTGAAGGGLELEAARPALAGEHRAQRLDRLAHPRQRLLERHPVPALDDHVRRRAEAEHEAPAATRPASAARAARARAGPARERVDDAGPQAHPLGCAAGERERREAVGAGGLARPEVVVAGRLGAAEEVAVVGERDAGERDASGPSGGRACRRGHATCPRRRANP